MEAFQGSARARVATRKGYIRRAERQVTMAGKGIEKQKIGKETVNKW